jgi:hypothetical protein
LYGPPPRLTRTSPLIGRLVWAIGDWGRASEHIGSRWEAVAGELASRRLTPSEGRLIVLGATPNVMAEVLASGLPHADALRAFRDNSHLALEPLDFKWSLETASARQVSGETLARLLDSHLPGLEMELGTARGELGLPEEAEVEPRDGRFLAPEHPANRAALRDEPTLPSTLLPVDPQTFFSSLPGWPAARALARMESCDLERVRSIEAVERYYRLGAGTGGALARLKTNLFDPEPARVDTPDEIASLRKNGVATSLNTLLMHLERELTARKVLEEQLAALPRSAYPFGRLRSDLGKAGVPKPILESRGALGRAYGEVTREVSAAIRAAGYELTTSGVAADEALKRLAAEPERWAAVAEGQAKVVAARLV